MNYSDYRFTLDIQLHQAQVSIPVTFGDSARRLCISLTDGRKPYVIGEGCMAVFNARKPDNTKIKNYCIIENNTVIYELTPNTTNCEGIVNCDITIYGTDRKVLSSPQFVIVVDERVVRDDDIPFSENDIDILYSAYVDEENRKTAEKTRNKNEVNRRNSESDRMENEYKRREEEFGSRYYHWDSTLKCVVHDENINNGDPVNEAQIGGRFKRENERIEAEKARKSAENSRVSSEVRRVESERMRDSSETERFNNELQRATSEAERNEAELIRSGNEIQRADAENTRVAAEANREFAEINRAIAESDRNENERNRGANESRRVAADNERNAKIKELDDTVREYSFKESERVYAEMLRENAETHREYYEDIRRIAEESRVSAELARHEAEEERDDAERIRFEAEWRRSEGFNSFKEWEDNRVKAENRRVEAENARVEAENKREAIIGDLDTALDAILAIQESLLPKTSTFIFVCNDAEHSEHTLEFEEGMTWGEWCSSAYNTVDLYISEWNTVYQGVAGVIDSADYSNPESETLIFANHTYRLN